MAMWGAGGYGPGMGGGSGALGGGTGGGGGYASLLMSLFGAKSMWSDIQKSDNDDPLSWGDFNDRQQLTSGDMNPYNYGPTIGFGIDRLARKLGASETSAIGAGYGAKLGGNAFGPWGALIGAGVGSVAQSVVNEDITDLDEWKMFRSAGSPNMHPWGGHVIPGMTEIMPKWTNPSLKEIFNNIGGLFS